MADKYCPACGAVALMGGSGLCEKHQAATTTEILAVIEQTPDLEAGFNGHYHLGAGMMRNAILGRVCELLLGREDDASSERPESVFYVWVDRPLERPKTPTTKPRKRHATLQSAVTEARRLAEKLHTKVIVMRVVAEMRPSNQVETGSVSTQEHALELGAQRENTDAQIDDPSSLRVVPRAPQDQQEEKEIQDHTRLVEPQPGSRTADPRGVDRGEVIEEAIGIVQAHAAAIEREFGPLADRILLDSIAILCQLARPIPDVEGTEPRPNRCEGRYPVPQTSPPREEPFEVTYRCGLPQGHAGPHQSDDGDTLWK